MPVGNPGVQHYDLYGDGLYFLGDTVHGIFQMDEDGWERAVSAGAEAPVGADASDDGKPETSAVKL